MAASASTQVIRNQGKRMLKNSYVFIMNQMHNELIKFEGTENGKKGDSVSARFREIFGGKLMTSVKAKGKKPSATIREHHFLVFSLDVGSDKVDTLEDALRLFSAPETVEGYRASTAAEADAARASKSVTVRELPEIMVFHLLRYTNGTQGSTKLLKPVHFLLEMVLNRQLLATPATKGRVYALVATIRHHGMELSSGHYTADVLHSSGKWLRCDDDSVVQITESDVLHAQAYVLFYKQQ